ncbi:related to acetyl-hydrolase [Rhynchosporium secalis]|uniref:Related to acetyl-hydrolase n=1 Tax=Rhynchosporium secalis TaxID=38038 RepID=A0A1E1MAS2_RHYSE|nr:related to acetyl-hydrolase [Rhynchosporium secalis]
MVFTTATVGGAVTPDVIKTFFSHYLNRKPLAQKPTAHISYDEGLSLIRKFLLYASHHTVEDIQRFTAQWVPHPRWIKLDEVKISDEYVNKAAEHIREQLGHHGIERVGGKTWWQWRRPGSELKAEWIEMRSDYNERKATHNPGTRVMLYVHGGAYFFGSVDEHRYQMQRHARKLKARVFARELCYDPTTIILAGDSAGGGMVVSMLVIMRDRGIPLPAGAVLISPWVDLTHSFPSVAANNPLDYIPPHGFHQKPSPSWPPPNSDDLLAIEEGIVKSLSKKDHNINPNLQTEVDAVQGFHVEPDPPSGTQNNNAAAGTNGSVPTANTMPGSGRDLSIMIDGKLVEVKDQIQMYASNQLISHPLVSPILQPSLGGLPPLLILTGGGEMLRDEQIYLAHKAANPTKYPPGDAYLDESPHDHNRNQVNRWKPTDVQLQVWDDLCHVVPTLSFTRPAKYMYRSIAQFGAWTLARAQKTEIEILDDDDVSVISQSESDEEEEAAEQRKAAALDPRQSSGQVGKAGDPLPPFKNHMIRQRVDRHGNIYNLEPASELAGCNLPPSEVGIIKEGPVKKWMAAKMEWDTKFASTKRRIQKQRAKEMAKGYSQFEDGDVPPPSALAGRRKAGDNLKEEKNKKSMGMTMWALWGSKHDEKTMNLEKEADKAPETTKTSAVDGAGARSLSDTKTTQGRKMDKGERPTYSRSRSRRRAVKDEHQTDNAGDVDENTPAFDLLAMQKQQVGTPLDENLTPAFAAQPPPSDEASPSSNNPAILVRAPTNDEEYNLKRPKAKGIAFPFSLKGHQSSASMTTLTSSIGIPPASDVRNSGTFSSGVPQNEADFEATTSTGMSTEASKAGQELQQGSFEENLVNGKAVAATSSEGKAVENGEIVSAERPPIETFVTASDIMSFPRPAP